MAVAAAAKTWVAVEMTNLLWQQPEEGVQGKLAIHDERDPGAWKEDTVEYAKEAHVVENEDMEYLSDKVRPWWLSKSCSIWDLAACTPFLNWLSFL